MNVSRIYEVHECDEHGELFDWERCRACKGTGRLDGPEMQRFVEWAKKCIFCNGHGSLKAATLAEKALRCMRYELRCESCEHPSSNGTWEGGSPPDAVTLANLTDITLSELRDGNDQPLGGAGLYSPCDEGCRHGGPIRGQMYPGLNDPPPPRLIEFSATYPDAAAWTKYMPVEASWRTVDVRTLGWPHDLRPERLAVLCLRCWATLDHKGQG